MGMLRSRSGSIVVSAFSHGVWNAVAYTLFGDGPKIGLLGIAQTSIYGAEIGVVGLLLNGVFALVLYATCRVSPRLCSRKLGRRPCFPGSAIAGTTGPGMHVGPPYH